MFLARSDQPRKKPRAARPGLEGLETRLQPSAGPVAAYGSAIAGLADRVESRVAAIEANVTNHVARLDATAHPGMRSIDRLAGRYNHLVQETRRRVHALTTGVDRRLGAILARSARADFETRAMAPTVRSAFRAELASAGSMVVHDATTARASPIGGVALTRSEATTDLASLDSNLRMFSATVETVQARIAALPPPPVHRAVPSRPVFARRLYFETQTNGLGTGTVTFTGLPGGDATTGSGFGIGSSVAGTGGAGARPGAGYTTITGNGTDTTGVGATVTAGHAPGEGITGLLVSGNGGQPTIIPAVIRSGA